MQGTGAIVLAAVLSALKVTGIPMREQRLVVFGAGTAGVGIADQIRDAMIRDGLHAEQAAAPGLAGRQAGAAHRRHDATCGTTSSRTRAPAAEVAGWASGDGAPSRCSTPSRNAQADDPARHLDRARGVHPGDRRGHERRVTTGRSSSRSRTRPRGSRPCPTDVIAWSKGKALVAIGIPVPPVEYHGVTLPDRPGQQRPPVPRSRPGHDRGRRQPGDRRDAARRGRGGGRAGRCQRDRAPRCCPRWRTCAPPRRPIAVAVARAAIAEGVATRKPDEPRSGRAGRDVAARLPGRSRVMRRVDNSQHTAAVDASPPEIRDLPIG